MTRASAHFEHVAVGLPRLGAGDLSQQEECQGTVGHTAGSPGPILERTLLVAAAGQEHVAGFQGQKAGRSHVASPASGTPA